MPTMTPAPDFQWLQAQRTIRGVLARHGITGADADDAVQDWTLSTMVADFTSPPYDPPAAAYMTAALVKRYGVGVILRDRVKQGRRAARRLGLEQPQPDGEPIGVRDTAPASTNPATMAEAGETLAERMPRYAQQARARGMTPAALALVAAGWGPLDDDDAAKASPSVPQCGPGYTPPAKGCRGLSTATDPNPATREAAAQRCRDQLAALAAGSITPRPAAQTAEPTAAEQAEQARQDWQSFKRKGSRMDAGYEDRQTRLMGDAVHFQ